MDRRRRPRAVALARALPGAGNAGPALLLGAAIAALTHLPGLGLALVLLAVLEAVRG